MQQAEPVFRETIWPQRRALVDAALVTVQDHLVPHFPAMAHRQAALLSLTWPSRIDAYLVTDCHDRFGGYSHPLTVGLANATGIELCETILHEATHVADVHTLGSGRSYLWPRLREHFSSQGLGKVAWDAWHGVIFAASAWQVKTSIDPDHLDYAIAHSAPMGSLYAKLKVPTLPSNWAEYASGALDKTEFIETLGQMRASAKEAI